MFHLYLSFQRRGAIMPFVIAASSKRLAWEHAGYVFDEEVLIGAQLLPAIGSVDAVELAVQS